MLLEGHRQSRAKLEPRSRMRALDQTRVGMQIDQLNDTVVSARLMFFLSF